MSNISADSPAFLELNIYTLHMGFLREAFSPGPNLFCGLRQKYH